MNTTDNNLLDKRTKGNFKLANGGDTYEANKGYETGILAGGNAVDILMCIGFIWGRTEEESKANAAFIVTACNSYDKLVEQNKVLVEAVTKFLKVINRSDAALHHYGDTIKFGEEAIMRSDAQPQYAGTDLLSQNKECHDFLSLLIGSMDLERIGRYDLLEKAKVLFHKTIS